MEKLLKENIEDIFALTPLQEGMLFHFLEEPEKDTYFEQLSFIISGAIDLNLFKKAWDFVVETNEMLRAVFRWENVKSPVQAVLEKHGPDFRYYALSNKESLEKNKEPEELKAADREETFDLLDVPFRVTLYKIDGEKHMVIISNHHILYDGWSNGIILKEFFNAYDDLFHGKTPVKPAKNKFKEFVKWTRGRDEEKQKAFWTAHLENFDSKTLLPIKSGNRKASASTGVETYELKLPRNLEGRLGHFAKEHQATLASIFYSAWGILLMKYTNSDDVVFGTTLSGRSAKLKGIEHIVGLFINTLPLRIHTGPGERLPELLQWVGQILLEREEYENTPLTRIKQWSELDNREDLFDSIVAVENYPLHRRSICRNSTLPVHSFDIYGVNNYDLTTVVTIFDDIGIRFAYNKDLFEAGAIARLSGHFSNILQGIVSGAGEKVAALEIMSPGEKKQVLIDFNTAAVHEYPGKRTVHGLFAQQVERAPHHTAVVYGTARLTYRALNARAGRLAKKLKEKGVMPGSIAAITADPSPGMITGILAVLKTGGSYLPLETGYPPPRIKHMLTDSKTRVLLTVKHPMPGIEFAGEVVNIEDTDIYDCNGDTVTSNRPAVPGDPVYVVYTSGTTGRPKGVVIKNENLFNYVHWFAKAVDLTAGDKGALISSAAFDLGYTVIYPSILWGGELHVPPKETYLDPEGLLKYIAIHGITYIKSTPSLLTTIVHSAGFSPGTCAGLRLVVLGGEPINLNDVEQLHLKCSHIKIMNHYGPTETTIGSAARFIDFDGFDEYRVYPTIGKPIRNTGVYILDKHLDLLPAGVPGELCIGGEGVALGYLNQPELTYAKFPGNIFSPGGVFYKTGDLARWLPDGDIQFLGRMDNQVKLRGYRVELGEIEHRLLNHHEIKEAAVIAGEDGKGGRYIAAYVVPSAVEMDMSGLREYLSKELPGYMVPSYIVPLEGLPLNRNGKLDRKALPGPEAHGTAAESPYAAPVKALEKKLVETWEKVLGRDHIGINDDFFAIGGDSIKAIQIVSRLNRTGYRVTIKDIFRNPSISQLEPHIKQAGGVAEQSVITGILPLTPIQKEFFSYSKIDPHHYNQAVLLYSDERIAGETLEAVFGKLQEHHDALRMNFIVHTGEETVQINRGLDLPVSLTVYDFRNREDALKALEHGVNKIHAGIDLEKGPLMKLGLFRLDDGDRLAIVIHHLVIDTVSWRILFEDIGELFRQYRKGEAFSLPPKTDSFKLWAEKLAGYANGQSLLKEKNYWKKLSEADAQIIKRDFNRGDNYTRDTGGLSFRLSEEETGLLLTEVNKAFGTEVDDIFLTALASGIGKTFGSHRLVVALEGHGREDIGEDVDVSRTVGWFTSVYPVLLATSHTGALAHRIKSIKETLRRVPRKGIGYGILKYLTDETDKSEMPLKLQPQVSFNYLGQFAADVGQMPFKIARESPGNPHSPGRHRKYEIDIIGIIVDKRLKMSIVYNKKQYKSETMDRLSKHYREELSRIISFCSARQERESTPADFSYKGLSLETLGRLSMRYPIEDIYTLTPTQEGMLFHALYESSSAYFVQISFRIRGKLDIPVARKSLNQLFKRYDILRTVFVYEGLDRPVQLVLKEREVDFLYKDIREISPGIEKDTFIETFKENDRKRSFNLGRDVLLRAAIIRVDEAEYVFTWSNHHILMDGWCRGVLSSDFFEIYSGYINDRPHRLPPVKPYRIYIQWLEQQDKEGAKKYWRDVLEGYKEAVGIPKRTTPVTGTVHEGYRREEIPFAVESEKVKALEHLAVKYRVTLSIIIQTIWAILLAKYNNKRDVVFGIVVSGRPSEIDGVESMVGLFINTIPVRIRFEEETTFCRLAQRVRDLSLASGPHQYFSLAEIQAQTPLKQNLLDHFLTFLNYPIGEVIKGGMVGKNRAAGGAGLEISGIESLERSNYNLDILIGYDEQLDILLRYNTNIYEDAFMKKLPLHIKEVILQVIENENITIKDILISHDRVIADPYISLDDGIDFDL